VKAASRTRSTWPLHRSENCSTHVGPAVGANWQPLRINNKKINKLCQPSRTNDDTVLAHLFGWRCRICRAISAFPWGSRAGTAMIPGHQARVLQRSGTLLPRRIGGGEGADLRGRREGRHARRRITRRGGRFRRKYRLWGDGLASARFSAHARPSRWSGDDAPGRVAHSMCGMQRAVHGCAPTGADRAHAKSGIKRNLVEQCR